ncbi:MAG TPA: DUF6624 domain-containing protein [Allosphingosinicella sp.]|jgi:hypothetical protein|nr:DUF6624 domain-containing protein [Allosphingosinicella sp.]
MRIPGLLLSSLFLVAAAPPPPPALAPYIKDGRFDPGDYGWMRGRFDGSSAADKADNASIRDWIERCFADGLARTRAELQAMGIAEPKLAQSDFREALCAEVASAPRVSARSFAAFQREAAAARPIAETWLLATRLAEEKGGPRGPALADRLLARPLGEQMLRTAMSWGDGEMKDAPALSADAKAILLSRLSAAVAVLDRRNTEWLKKVVDAEGWPTLSKVGPAASQQAWLLAQHADADPAFQLRVLRLMEPMALEGEVSKPNYAYLYDRVMLKLSGKQRYATQMTCKDGKRVPQPLEDEKTVGAGRAAMQLEPLPEYMASMRALYGECPPAPAVR